MKTIDLNTCKPGQKLRTRSGETYTYLGLAKDLDPDSPGTPEYPHRVRDQKTRDQRYTHSGRYFDRGDDNDRDIVEILPLENPVDDIDDTHPAPDTPPRGWLRLRKGDRFQKGDYISSSQQWARGLVGSLVFGSDSVYRHPDRFPKAKPAKTKTKTARELYVEGQKLADFRPGERVKVLFQVPDDANGWDNVWSDGMEDMDGFVGKVGEVVHLGFAPERGVAVERDGQTYHFPWFCLERVSAKPVKVKLKLNGTWTAEVVSKDKVKVGDRSFETERFRELVRRIEAPAVEDFGLNGAYNARIERPGVTSVTVEGRTIELSALRALLAAVDAFPA